MRTIRTLVIGLIVLGTALQTGGAVAFPTMSRVGPRPASEATVETVSAEAAPGSTAARPRRPRSPRARGKSGGGTPSARHRPAATSFELLTRPELVRRGHDFLFPPDDQMAVMPRECWALIVDNPHQADHLPAAAISTVGGQRAATVAFVHRVLALPDREITSAWDFSFYATPTGREAGVAGLMMYRALMAFGREGVPLASHGATPSANRIYQALRMTSLGMARRLVLPLQARPIVERYVRPRAASGVLAAALDPGLQGWAKGVARVLRARFGAPVVREVDPIGSADLPPAAARPTRPMLKRDPATLNLWVRYAREIRGAVVRCFSIANDGTGSPCAYFVGRIATHERIGSQGFRDVRVLRVLDLVVEEGSGPAAAAFQSLTDLAVRERCELIEMVTTDGDVVRFGRRLGFLPANGYATYMSSVPREGVFPAGRPWLLTMFESEAAYY